MAIDTRYTLPGRLDIVPGSDHVSERRGDEGKRVSRGSDHEATPVSFSTAESRQAFSARRESLQSTHALYGSSAEVLRHVCGYEVRNFGYEPAAPNALREKEYLKDTVANIRKCAAATTALDDQVPPLLNKLRERGLWDKTLILFAGDNGYLLGRHGLWSKGLASNPINMYDEVMKVPLIMSWPGRIPTDAVAPEMVSFYDVMPTLCDAAGLTPPAGHTLCGRSFPADRSSGKAGKKERWRNLVFGEFRNAEMARDSRYKIVVRNGGEWPKRDV